jgi:hypothetical protein
MKTSSLIVLCLLICLPAFSQTHVVRGKITAFNQYPVQNVEVEAKKSKTSVRTDSLGQFELVCNKKDAIQVKHQAFVPFSKKVNPGDESISANLVFKDSKKNRELVTSMGNMDPDQLSYALEHLSHENNNFCNFSNIFNLLKTNYPEIQVAGGKQVFLRGVKTMSSSMSNEAVYEVDGMIVTDISFVVPCEVATIDIMKSGGTAVYGTQAINGVLIIKTKGYK